MNNNPRMEARVEALETTLSTLIAWLHRELGHDAVNILLRRLEEGKSHE